RVLRDRLYSTLPNGIGGVTAAAGPGDEVGGTFDVEITLPGPEEVAGWLAEHAAGEGRTGVAVSGTWGRRLPRPGRAHRGRRAGAGGLAGRPRPAQGDARCQGPVPRPGRPWPGTGRADHRHRARR